MGLILLPLAWYATQVGVVWIGLFRNVPWLGDAQDYVETSIAIATHQPMPGGHYWPPGLPYLLAAISHLPGASVVLVRGLALALGALLVLAVVWLARVTGADRQSARLAGLLAASYPPLILIAGQPFSQVLSALTVTIALAAFLNWQREEDNRAGWWLVISAASAAYAILTRPSNLAFAVALTLGTAMTLVQRRRSGAAATGLWALPTAAIVAGIILFPTLRFNHDRIGAWTISTNNERNFFLGNNRFTPLYKTWHLASRELADLPAPTVAYLEEIYGRPDRNPAMLAEARLEISEHPGRFVVRTLSRVRAFWGVDYLSSNLLTSATGLSRPLSLLLMAYEAGGYLILVLIAWAGLVALWRFDRVIARSLMAALIAIQLPYAIAFASGTYHFTAIGVLLVLAAVGIRSVGDATQRRLLLGSRPVLIGWAALLLIQLEYAWWVLRSA